ncbi:MAG: GNAT family N-acetyltransferase [Defluviitaleaceae bacterium]|nr:GNAT family N-acetyltransferase [Defluviitaleaceae bacterium]
MVKLKAITEENYEDCLALKVSDNQSNFVASNAYSLAQAWVFYNTAYPFAIYAGDVMVGFVMMSYFKPKGVYDIWRFMIDKRFQGKGYGKAALALAIKYLKEEHNAGEISLSFEPNNSIAEKLYASAGFQRTGEVDDGEIVMCL